MQPADIRKLIEKAISPGMTSWADLGSGDGAFTMALYELLREANPAEEDQAKIQVYAVDKSTMKIFGQKHTFERQFGADLHIKSVVADFTKALDIPPASLDGILLANSIHFIRDKVAMLQSVKKLLKPGGSVVIVEYNIDEGNHFVPFPMSFDSLSALASSTGFGAPELLATAPSEYWNEMYAGRMKG